MIHAILALAIQAETVPTDRFVNLTRDRAAEILRVDFYQSDFPPGDPHPTVVVQTDVFHPGRYEVEVSMLAPDGAVFVNVVGFDAPTPGVFITEHHYSDLIIMDMAGWTVNGVLREIPRTEAYAFVSGGGGGGGGGCASRGGAAAPLAALLLAGLTATSALAAARSRPAR